VVEGRDARDRSTSTRTSLSPAVCAGDWWMACTNARNSSGVRCSHVVSKVLRLTVPAAYSCINRAAGASPQPRASGDPPFFDKQPSARFGRARFMHRNFHSGSERRSTTFVHPIPLVAQRITTTKEPDIPANESCFRAGLNGPACQPQPGRVRPDSNGPRPRGRRRCRWPARRTG
jgi:hypothetical protein